MKATTALLTPVLTACLTLPAAAQEIDGQWQAESVNSVEPAKGTTLKLSFGEDSMATLTYTVAGESQSWRYTYAVADGQLTIEPANPFGEPQTVTYDIKFDEGKLLLLTPKPEPVEEETEEVDSGLESEEAAEAEGEEVTEEETTEEAAEETTEEEAEEDVEEEEEDTRVPVWVLIKA